VRPRNLAAAIADVEKELIVATLDRTRGNVSETARLLGLTRRGLYLKMRRLRLDVVGADT
jgi:DNA-binding NtrC family response regulator